MKVGLTAIHEMTTTEFGLKKSPKGTYYTLLPSLQKNFQRHDFFHQSCLYFFPSKEQQNKTPKQHRTKLCDWDCKFKNTSPVEMMVLKIIGSISDCKLWARIVHEKNKSEKVDVGRTQQDIYDQAHRREFLPRVEKRKKKTSRR